MKNVKETIEKHRKMQKNNELQMRLSQKMRKIDKFIPPFRVWVRNKQQSLKVHWYGCDKFRLSTRSRLFITHVNVDFLTAFITWLW